MKAALSVALFWMLGFGVVYLGGSYIEGHWANVFANDQMYRMGWLYAAIMSMIASTPPAVGLAISRGWLR